MGIGVSLILIAAGAILTWAVTADVEGVDITVVGVILMVIGAIGFILSTLFWSSWGGVGGFRRRTYVEDRAARRPYVEEPRARTTTYVEEDVAGPPPGGPPPA